MVGQISQGSSFLQWGHCIKLQISPSTKVTYFLILNLPEHSYDQGRQKFGDGGVDSLIFWLPLAPWAISSVSLAGFFSSAQFLSAGVHPLCSSLLLYFCLLLGDLIQTPPNFYIQPRSFSWSPCINNLLTWQWHLDVFSIFLFPRKKPWFSSYPKFTSLDFPVFSISVNCNTIHPRCSRAKPSIHS